MTNRAILLSLAISLTAFFTGVCAGRFRLPPIQNETAFERHTQLANPGAATMDSDELNLREIRLVCEPEALRPFWNDLVTQLSYRLFYPPLRPVYDCSEFLKVAEIDLNADGVKEFIVTITSTGICLSSENCPVAFYQRGGFQTMAGGRFPVRRILYADGESYTIERTSNNGFPDLSIRQKGADEDYVSEYKFDGRYYWMEKCYGENKKTGVRFEGCD
ncbi:MAG TPA: hypothetical protein VNA22_09360 [Pyrinomonadaceae bacterium]|nr:hypothetical protein [Pyrinomonadaceae bacterium]